MYEIILEMIGAPSVTGGPELIIVQACCTLVLIVTCVLIDMVYRLFSHFWRG